LEETTHKGIRKRVIYYFPFLTKPGQTWNTVDLDCTTKSFNKNFYRLNKV
jgi:hypothetical protein